MFFILAGLSYIFNAIINNNCTYNMYSFIFEMEIINVNTELRLHVMELYRVILKKVKQTDTCKTKHL